MGIPQLELIIVSNILDESTYHISQYLYPYPNENQIMLYKKTLGSELLMRDFK